MSNIVSNSIRNYLTRRKSPFSIYPYLTNSGALSVYQNSISFNSPIKNTGPEVPPVRTESDIKGFSANARRRMMLMFTRVDYQSYYSPLFISATFHNDFKLERIFLKKTLDKFLKNLKYNLPPFDHIWKLELQKREAPHFHFMILFKKKSENLDLKKIKIIIEKCWIDLKMCDCEYCKLYSIKTKIINDYKHAMIYISKELGKITQNKFKCDIGNYWNHSRKIRIKKYETIPLKISDIHEIITDYFYTHPNLKIDDNYKNKILTEPYSFTLFCPLEDIQISIQKFLKEKYSNYSFKEKFGITKQQFNNLNLET